MKETQHLKHTQSIERKNTTKHLHLLCVWMKHFNNVEKLKFIIFEFIGGRIFYFLYI